MLKYAIFYLQFLKEMNNKAIIRAIRTVLAAKHLYDLQQFYYIQSTKIELLRLFTTASKACIYSI
jgi:hypothetical protein